MEFSLSNITEIPKLITDTSPYFQYEGSTNATTQDELQAFMKNEHGVVEALTNAILWQPSTAYEKGQEVRSPNMPAGFTAVCKVAGISGTNEPDWGTGGTDVTDASCTWTVTKGNITVNGKAPDASGNITVDEYSPDYASDSEAITGTSTTKIMTPKATDAVIENIGYWKPNEAVSVNVIRFIRGTAYAGYYLICNTAGTTGSTEPKPTAGTTALVSDGSVKWYLRKIISSADVTDSVITDKNITVTQSTQWDKTITVSNVSPIDSSSGSQGGADYLGTRYYLYVTNGVGAKTASLKSIIQELVNKSHTHSTKREYYGYNCRCDCPDNDSCIIHGNILTTFGYKPIELLQIGDYIVSNDNKPYRVTGIKTSCIGFRKAIGFQDNEAVYTDDHLFLINNEYRAYNIAGYNKEASKTLTDGKVNGTYARVNKREVLPIENIVIFDMPSDTVTYTPIVENCEWCIVNGKVVACARYLPV